MTKPTENDRAPLSLIERRRQARRKVRALKGCYIHTFVFVCVLTGLIVVDLTTGTPYWAHWVALGWGMGVLGHWALIVADFGGYVRRWEARKFEQFMKEDGRP